MLQPSSRNTYRIRKKKNESTNVLEANHKLDLFLVKEVVKNVEKVFVFFFISKNYQSNKCLVNKDFAVYHFKFAILCHSYI